MAFYVDFTVRRGGSLQKGIEISYLYNGSKKDLKIDYTDKNGEARTEWNDIWRNRNIEVFFDGGGKRNITLKPRDSHTINLPSGCFPYETRILTPVGMRRLGDINDGDLVFAINPANGLMSSRKVIKKIEHDPMRLVEVNTKSGISLLVTKTHRLLTLRGYIAVENLRVGDRLSFLGDSLAFIELESVIDIGTIEPVYNLIVADDFSFIADGFLAHSFATTPRLQKVFWGMYGSFRNIGARPPIKKIYI